MERYAAYKDSGVEWIGEIPEGWKIQKISSLYDARNEKVSDKDYPPLSVTMQGILPQLDTAAKTQDGDNRKLVRKGDFAINSRSDRRGSCGVSDYDGSVSLITNVLAPRNLGAMDSHYYSYLFHTENFADEFYKNGTGIVDDLWSTNWSRMKKIQIPLPELGAQKAIAAYLDKKTAEIDGIVEETERSIELLREYRKSIISEVVTHGLNPDVAMKDSGIEWIGEIPEGWSIKRQRYLCSVKTGDSDTQDSNPDGAYPFYVRSPNIERSDKYTFEGEAVLMAGDGAGAGRVFHYVNGKYAVHQRVYRFADFNKVLGKYLYWYDLAFFPRLMDMGSAESTVPSVRLPMILNLAVSLPSETEQQEIIDYLDVKTAEIDGLIADKEKQVELLKEYRKSLISEAVTGKFKVPGLE